MLHKILTAVTALAVVASLLAGAAGQAAAVTGYDSAYFGESAFLTLGPGQSGQFAVGFNNTGSTGWLTGSTSQVDLAVCQADKVTCNTTSPNAAFASTWLSSTAYATTSTTYVGPGQTGYFTYNVMVPTGATPGTYRFNGDVALHGTASMIHQQGYYQDVEVPNVGAPAKLACTATPTTMEAGSTSASSTVTVSVQDSLGNTVTTDQGRNIQLAQSGLLASGQPNGSLDGGAQGAAETKGDVNGVATFTLQTAGAAGVGTTATGTDQLSATTTNTAITGCTANITFTANGVATQLNETVFNPSGTTATANIQYQYPAGVASHPDVRARLKDAAGVTVNAASDTVVTFTVDNGAICNFGTTASDPAATTRSQTISTGSPSTTVLGSTPVFWVTGVPGSCTITESSPGLTSASKTLTVAASGPASKLAVTSNTCSNTPTTAQLASSTCDVVVQVQDASGNPVFASGTSITMALSFSSRTVCAAMVDATNSTAVTPNATITGTTNGAGNVDFEVIDSRAETCNATATSAGLTQTATTVSFTGFGTADHLAASSSPSDMPNNGVSTSTVTVCVKDSSGNTVTTASDSIGLNRSASSATSGAATNLISASPSSAASGCATFTVQSSGNTAATAGTDTWTPNDNTRTLPLIVPNSSATVHTF
jgi:hypothetical protein